MIIKISYTNGGITFFLFFIIKMEGIMNKEEYKKLVKKYDQKKIN